VEETEFGRPPSGGPSADPGAGAPAPAAGENAASAGIPHGEGAAELPGKRRRRKRRRGRRAFIRDPQAPVVAASAPPPPPEQVKRHNGMPPPDGADFRRGRSLHAGSSVYAALDLGTNNCRLLVAVPTRPGQFRVIDAFSRIVRLGEGLSASGRLSEAAMDRAVDALKVCADKLALRDIRGHRLIATEACRAAENGAEFLARVEEETGLRLEIIDRETEARLAVSGCGSLVERDTDAVVLFDIGGGSSEIALIDVSRRRGPRLASHIVAWTSLPVGVVSLAERFGGRQVTRENFAAMIAEVGGLLEGFAGRERLGELARGSRFHLLGTSGTVTTLAGVHLGLARYDRRQVDGLWMAGTEVDAMIERLLVWEFHERVANPCIGADRADLVLAGCAILEAIRRVWPAQRLRVADRGLREGILSELMADDGAWRQGRGRRGGWPR
jgi:exopolyphosphatase/guanosine-5'-triphosphate,3'-diphosphate pyrophosphatase